MSDGVHWSEFTARPAAPLDAAAVQAAISGKRVLITGAGGFVGSALALMVARLSPRQLICLDQAESGLYQLQQDLDRVAKPDVRLVAGSVTDACFLGDVFGQYTPHVVFHAAACKHVPLMEVNPITAVVTNALGTRCVLRAARESVAEQMILLSTDKAVEPVSIMGASKRIAELIVLSSTSDRARGKVLRLGNILGSTGSVAPLFVEQIAEGGPVTVAHPEAKRYFLPIEDAVRHLLSVLVASRCGLFVPEMGEPRKVRELAEFLIGQRAGTGTAIEVRYTGLRPGDKLSEVLLSADERATRVHMNGLQEVETRLPTRGLLEECLDGMEAAAARRDIVGLLTSLRAVVPEYEMSAKMRSYVQSRSEVSAQ